MSLARTLRPLAVAAAMIAAGAASAQSVTDRIEARQGQFKLFALHLGPLAMMAQGRMDYDAAVAQAAADNLVSLSGLDQGLLWPEGSDSVAMTGTRARPAIWENPEDFAAKLAALNAGAVALAAVAGDGQAALGGALGGVAGACSACHQAYRQ